MRREITRLEALSDGVFAFAATLLVVRLDAPDSFAELRGRLPELVPLAIAFGALVLIWSAHAGFFRRTGLDDGPTVAWNACLLFTVLYFVHPLRMLAQGFADFVFGIEAGRLELRGTGELAELFTLYGVGFCAIFCCLAALYARAAREGVVAGATAASRNELAFLARHYALFVLVGLLSIAVAWSGLGVRFGSPGWIFVVLGPLAAWHGRWSERRRPWRAS